MIFKVYLHYNSLKAFNEGHWVNAKLQFIGQTDVEVLIDFNEVVFSYQQSGFTIRKKKWYEKLFRLKSIR